jgi:hypothetical protein
MKTRDQGLERTLRARFSPGLPPRSHGGAESFSPRRKPWGTAARTRLQALQGTASEMVGIKAWRDMPPRRDCHTPGSSTRENGVARNKRFLFETNPNSIENKGSLEERTQTNPPSEAKRSVQRTDFMEDRTNFGAIRERCRKQMRYLTIWVRFLQVVGPFRNCGSGGTAPRSHSGAGSTQPAAGTHGAHAALCAMCAITGLAGISRRDGAPRRAPRLRQPRTAELRTFFRNEA